MLDSRFSSGDPDVIPIKALGRAHAGHVIANAPHTQ
jgi:hypothetical protein